MPKTVTTLCGNCCQEIGQILTPRGPVWVHRNRTPACVFDPFKSKENYESGIVSSAETNLALIE